jgi:SAM-dependent methyltransferase
MGRATRLYDDLAGWWPLLSPPSEYEAEAADLLPRLGEFSASSEPTLLELGSGGGSLAYHLKQRFRLTLTDLSPAMLEVSRKINPECEHLVGDMRSLRLGRVFDAVLVHDAIMYATQPADVRATLHTAAVHCRPGGVVAVLPDYIRESFASGTDHGGHDAPDGRGLRYLEWAWDPDPGDDTYVVDYAFLLRASDGMVTVAHDRHVEGLFSRTQWLRWFEEAGIPARGSVDPFGREIYIASRLTGIGEEQSMKDLQTAVAIQGKTIRFTWTDGPTKGLTHEHIFHQDGTVEWHDITASRGSPREKPPYAAIKVTEDVHVVSYLSPSSGYTLTVVLNFQNRRVVGFASSSKDWHPVQGTFEVDS